MSEASSMYRLVVLKGADTDFRTVIREPSILVGSDEKCRVCLADAGLAPQHLALRLHEGQVVLQVLQGAGEVLRSGEVLSEAVLHHGDVLEIGGLHLQFQVVRPLPFHPHRSAGLIYAMAGAGLALVLGLELVVVGWLWHAGPGEFAEIEEVEAATEGPDLDALTNELANARTRLESLQAQQGDLSPEDLWASGGSVDLAREIEQVRTRVRHLDTTLTQLEMPGGPTRDLPGPGDVQAKAREMLTEARRAIAANDLAFADRRLSELLELAPDSISAYMTRARLHERMGDRQAAITQWEEVTRRAVDPTVKEEATASRVRLLREIRQEEARALEARETMLAAQEEERRKLEAQREADRRTMAEEEARQEEARRQAEARAQAEREAAAREQAAREQAARETAERERMEQARLMAGREQARREVAQTPKVVQIESVRREKFQNRENYEEIRLVRIELKRRKSGGPILHNRFRIEVEFFDKEPTTGQVLASRVPSPHKGLDLVEDWIREDRKSFSALYMVPRGFRASERARTGNLLQFHGYLVRVYYNDQLQDEHAFPSALLKR